MRYWQAGSRQAPARDHDGVPEVHDVRVQCWSCVAICWRRVRRVCSHSSFSREVPVHAGPAPTVGVPLQGVFIKHKHEACSRGGSGQEALVSEDIAVPEEHSLNNIRNVLLDHFC